MSAIKTIERLKKVAVGERVHFIIQSLNGYRVQSSALNKETSELCNLLEESNISIICDEPILKNDFVILLTVPEITHSNQKTFDEVSVFGLEHQFKLIEDIELSNNIINLFRVE
jgi:hypothetical protein